MLTGTLESFGLIDVLGVIKKDSKSCILSVEAGYGNYVVVYFKEGNPVFIRFVKKSFMVYLDMDFESILRKEGVDRRNLTVSLAQNLPSLLGLRSGRFSVTTGFIRYPPDIIPDIKTEKLIISLSRTLSEQEVKRKITDDSLVFEPEDGVQDIDLSLNDIEKSTLMMVDGKNDVLAIESKVLVEELLKSGNAASGDRVAEIRLNVKRALYGFLTAGLIRHKLKLKKNENIFDRIINLLDLRYQKKLEV